jgi:hypothetical protein
MPHTSSIPMTDKIVPLMAVTVGAGWEENSVSTARHASAVHTCRAFHAVRDNTSHSRRVTRRGVLFIGWSQSSKREQAEGRRFDALFEMAQNLTAESKLVKWNISIA